MFERLACAVPGGAAYLTRFLAVGLALGTCLQVLSIGPASAANLDNLIEDLEPNELARNDPVAPFHTPVCHARLRGQITGPDPDAPEGTPERLGDAMNFAKTVADIDARLTATLGPAPKGEFPALCLVSSGGDLSEALKLAELFRGWMMVVEEKAECISACAVLFMSSVPRDRVFLHNAEAPGRFLHHTGRLGFHAPRLEFPLDKACSLIGKETEPGQECMLTPAEAARLATQSYADAVASVKRIAVPADEATGSDLPTAEHQSSKWTFADRVTHPFSRDLPSDLLLAFLTVPPHDSFDITRIEEAMSWGIEIYGVPPPPVLTEAMLKSACLNVAAARCALSPGGECADRNFASLTKRFANLGIQSEADIEAMQASIQKRVMDIATKPICELVSVADCEALPPEKQSELRTGLIDELQKEVVEIRDQALDGARYLGPYAVGVRLGGKRLRPADLQPLTARKVNLWPAGANGAEFATTGLPIFTQAFELKLDTAQVCEIRVLWAHVDDLDKDFLLNMKIDTAALDRANERPLTAVVDPRSDHPSNTQRYLLRPWMMLPAGTRLVDIAAPDPWGWTDDGSEFFDKPANWFAN